MLVDYCYKFQGNAPLYRIGGGITHYYLALYKNGGTSAAAKVLPLVMSFGGVWSVRGRAI